MQLHRYAHAGRRDRVSAAPRPRGDLLRQLLSARCPEGLWQRGHWGIPAKLLDLCCHGPGAEVALTPPWCNPFLVAPGSLR